MTPDRILYNEPDDWLGPDYAIGDIDEIVASDVLVHIEMMTHAAAYLGISRGGMTVDAHIHARPTTRAERRDILTHNEERLRDHAKDLLPRWLGGNTTIWAIPPHRRPASALRSWWDARRSANTALCILDDHNNLIPPESACPPS